MLGHVMIYSYGKSRVFESPMVLNSTNFRVQVESLRDMGCIDPLFRQLAQQLSHLTQGVQRVYFDLRDVTFITPFGTIALMLAIRTVLQYVPYVELINVGQKIIAYLRRADFHAVCGDRLILPAACEEFSRNSTSFSIIEIHAIPHDGPEHKRLRTQAFGRLKDIFSTWFPSTDDDEDRSATLSGSVGELMKNISYSGSMGYMTAQKYMKRNGQEEVCIAVGDLGCGIRQSLLNREAFLRKNVWGATETDYIRRALSFHEHARSGGTGLTSVVENIVAWDGCLSVRSATGRVTVTKKTDSQEQDISVDNNLNPIPGVQIEISVRA